MDEINPDGVQPSNSNQQIEKPTEPAYTPCQTGTQYDIPPSRSKSCPQDDEYAQVDIRTISWEVARHDVKVGETIGEGAFGQVAKGTADNLPFHSRKSIVAVKMLKGKDWYKRSQNLQAFIIKFSPLTILNASLLLWRFSANAVSFGATTACSTHLEALGLFTPLRALLVGSQKTALSRIMAGSMALVCILNLRPLRLLPSTGSVDVTSHVLFCIYKPFAAALHLIAAHGTQVYRLAKFVVFEKSRLVDVIVVRFGKDFAETSQSHCFLCRLRKTPLALSSP